MSRARRIGATRIDLNELIKRSALAVLAILAVLLPVLKVSLVSESDDIVLGDFRLLGRAAYLLLVAFLCGLSLHRHGRIDHRGRGRLARCL
ncbi:hypothetical protein [Rhizobium sp. IBUN]|uniref:hypothetical protein n=1 Tax=Rhizobium sp. IBUN TaxID=1042326 RepID=UPI001FD9D525|nr:hypothetical protein [Rhizobium sp. IBUN]